MTKSVQIEEQSLNKLNKLKQKIKAHNMTEVIEYLLDAEKQNMSLKIRVDEIDSRLSKLEKKGI